MLKTETEDNLSDKPRVTSAKHDILYSKARYVLNQRHIKRPWFNLNPFLEKTVDLADLDQFLPGDSKYIQPLESLVLCESFHSNYPVDTTELAIDVFFAYLHSDKWSKGCSIRVLEGQLLDQLLLGLYRLEHEGKVVRHTTHAFARNNRQRMGCYKQSTAESLGTIAETILIEFAYFGQLTKQLPNVKKLDPFEYLNKQDINEVNLSEVTTEIPEAPVARVPVEERKHRAHSLSTNAEGHAIAKSKWSRRGSLMSKHINAINAVKALQLFNERRQSGIGTTNRSNINLPPEKSKPVSPHSSLENKRNYISSPPSAARNRKPSVQEPTPSVRRHSVAASPFVYSTSHVKRVKTPIESREVSEAEEDKLSPKLSKKCFVGRIYELDFEEENMSEEEVSIDDETEPPVIDKKAEEFFGDELYLSDKLNGKQKPLSTKKKLQLNKIELHKKRKEVAEMKARKKQSWEKGSKLPPLPSLDLSHIDSQNLKHETISMPDEMPTFEEFIQLLKEDEYYDPRYRNRMRLKSRRIAQRYYIAKGQHRSSIFYNFKTMPSEIRNLGGYRPSSRKPSVSTVNKGSSSNIDAKKSSDTQVPRLPVLEENGGKLVQSHNSLANGSRADLEHQSDEVKGVTDSESCKEHYLKHREVDSKDNVSLSIKRSSHIKPQPTKDSQHSGSNINSMKSQTLFPKNTQCDEETEISDAETDETEDEGPVSDVFDTKKLNLRYSIERLRKKRRSRTKKKPAFIEILAKYYNMQNALRVFRKGEPGKEAKGAKLRATGLGTLIGKALVKKEPERPIGKLKHFDFCDVKPKKSVNLDYLARADFTRPDLDGFTSNLKEALNKFVIRREIVVSDVQTFYSATTSVTFTRKSCFQYKHVECMA